MREKKIPSGLQDWYRKEFPFVHKDGTISNLDPAIASKIAGVKMTRSKDGSVIFRERRPGRCIFCGGKKCTKNLPLMVSCKGGLTAFYRFLCCSEQFKGRTFCRDADSVASRWLRLIRKERTDICPMCGSSKWKMTKKESLSRKGKSKGWMLRSFECGNCVYKGTVYY